LVEPAGDDDPRALHERVVDVLGHLAPGDDVEEAGLLLPLLGLAVLPASADRHPEVGLRLAAAGVAELGVAGEVAGDGDGVAVGHWSGSSLWGLALRHRSRRLGAGLAPL